jgi:GntR family transcriptional regulator / MocR family aminotransferase
VPDRLLAAVVAEKRRTDGQTSTLTQLTMAQLLRSGGYDRHVRRMRRYYRRRRDHLLRELARQAPHVAVTGISAGLSCATPPEHRYAAAVAALAQTLADRR